MTTRKDKKVPPMSRSQQMAAIRGKDTAPENLLRRRLWQMGLRYRLHFRTPVGLADLAFPRQRLAVFVDGCFWHGCPDHYVPPRSSRSFWSRKLRENVGRDQRQTERLQAQEWRVLRFWEHEVFVNPELVADAIAKTLRGEVLLRGLEPRVIEVAFLDEGGVRERRWLQSLCPVRDLGSIVRERSTAKWKAGPTNR